MLRRQFFLADVTIGIAVRQLSVPIGLEEIVSSRHRLTVL
jgi:hypothetical protein